MQGLTFADLEHWEVYRLPNVAQMEPPKPKFVVIVDISAQYFRGFVINREYPPFVKKYQTHLQVCFAAITLAEHGFLWIDSLVDCTQIYTFGWTDLAAAQYAGVLSTNGAEAVQKAVALSDTIKPKTQNMIAGLVLPQ